ncbi:MAG: hypothetical protein GY715_21530, partial [Planctomycetes bacterium]|nr:hypothetical protein [Planctomycetota bacterium]
HLTSPEQDPVDRRLQSAGGGAGDVEQLTSPEQDPVDRRLRNASGGAGPSSSTSPGVRIRKDKGSQGDFGTERT